MVYVLYRPNTFLVILTTLKLQVLSLSIHKLVAVTASQGPARSSGPLTFHTLIH